MSMPQRQSPFRDFSLLTDHDLYLFNEGSHFRLYEKLGAHHVSFEGAEGTYFAVWAPDAYGVYVIGSFNDWKKETHALRPRGSSGIWEGFFPDVKKGSLYKYHIVSRTYGYQVDKSDPFSFFNEIPPRTASIAWDLDYAWGDGEWMARRREHNALDKPMSIYEVHLGSWRRVPDEGNRSLSYRELAQELADYVKETGFTHVEFLPIMDHPFFGSWGYQITGYFAPSANYGTPQGFMYLIDVLHRNGIGVILDWVPSHFPTDEHGLGYFDGTHLFEHADPRQGMHREWGSYAFNYGRHEVRSFLVSNALFWLGEYHVDGLRVDAVRRCFISITRGSKANGFRISSAGAKISARSIFSAASMRRSIKRIPTRRRSPRSRPHGRWSPARRTWAGWVSASSGTWAGCTTRWTICPRIRSTVNFITTA
jgi:1,4-alpha-glucan branching enzyme